MLLKSHFWTGWAAHPQLHQYGCKEGNLFFSLLVKNILMYMIEAFKQKKLLIIMIVDTILSIGIPFGIHGICVLAGVENFGYSFFFAIFAFANGLAAYLSGDIILISYKHKNDIVTSPIPDDVYLKSKQVRYPYIVAMLADIIIFVIFVFYFSGTGHWPLM